MGKKCFRTANLTMCAFFTALTAVGAFIRIPVPVLPFTLQFLFTTLAGLLLGEKLGAISVGVYVLLGLAGLPVFVSGGGISYVLQPTFGYLIGFAVGAWMTGTVAGKEKTPSSKRLFAACFLGLGAVYLCGMAYYWMISVFYLKTGIGLWTLFLYCFVLAVPGDIVLCILSAALGRRLIPLLKPRLDMAGQQA